MRDGKNKLKYQAGSGCWSETFKSESDVLETLEEVCVHERMRV